MKQRSEAKRRIGLAAVLMIVAFLNTGSLPADDAKQTGFDPKEWLDGPQGLVKGIATAETEKRILIVYFYADWCGYCRQFEKDLLGTPAFRAFVRDNEAVRINPDTGDGERRLAAYYGVRGYPTFFVYGSRSKGLIGVERHTVVNGRPELLSPAQFITRITEASER
jgi:thioredoxin-related protein